MNYNNDVDFLAFQNYAWLMPVDVNDKGYIGLGEQNLRMLVKESLLGKGLTETSIDKADVLIAVNVTEKEKVHYSSSHHGYYPYSRWGYSHHWVEPEQYTESTIVLAFIDTKTKQALWEASAKNSHFEDLDDENLQKLIEAFFKHFPPLLTDDLEDNVVE